jgi:hypothetical protein
MPYRNWAKMDDSVKRELRASAKAFLDTLDAGG